jgi:predicted NAD-dependent protein-ADP-ribosyltransferase YbiA (DUF1768 family)
MPTLFYNQREQPYGCFSNFSPHGFTLDEIWWPTSEHYFQAQKFVGTPYHDYYWGRGTEGTGRNMLGKILMEVRQILRVRESV